MVWQSSGLGEEDEGKHIISTVLYKRGWARSGDKGYTERQIGSGGRSD
jgi:hypothetical protein